MVRCAGWASGVTATVPRLGPPAQVGGPRVRLDARPGHVYAYDVRIGGVVVEYAYIGRARDVDRRDRQHRGLAPQRDGVVKEQPWADQIVRLRVVTSGVWTDAELDAEEVRLIHTLAPVLNDKDNRHNPSRIPIYTQHHQRKERDPNWVIPDWSRPAPSRDVSRPSWVRLGTSRLGRWAGRKLRDAARRVAPWFGLWLVLCVAGFVLDVPDAPAAAAGVTVLGLLAWVGRKKKAPKRRRTRRQ